MTDTSRRPSTLSLQGHGQAGQGHGGRNVWQSLGVTSF